MPGGRPYKRVTRERMITIRLTYEQHSEIRAEARAARCTVSEYVRRRMAINRWGNLTNQGVRALNEIALKAPQATKRDRLADEVTATRKLLVGAAVALARLREPD